MFVFSMRACTCTCTHTKFHVPVSEAAGKLREIHPSIRLAFVLFRQFPMLQKQLRVAVYLITLAFVLACLPQRCYSKIKWSHSLSCFYPPAGHASVKVSVPLDFHLPPKIGWIHHQCSCPGVQSPLTIQSFPPEYKCFTDLQLYYFSLFQVRFFFVSFLFNLEVTFIFAEVNTGEKKTPQL